MIHAFASHSPNAPLTPYDYTPGPPGPDDVEIKIECCGLCHSDLHLIQGEWPAEYPLIPGHEIIGHITKASPTSKELKSGDRVGVGWQCGACLACPACLSGQETSCPSKIRTCVNRPGGFADKIIVNHQFVYPIPAPFESTTCAPLLCAGITVYSPLRTYVTAPMSVAIIGIGGLGHLALQFARAFGCEVTAISTTPAKKKEAHAFGADHFLLLQDLKPNPQFDFILSTVHADLDWGLLLSLLKPSGKLCCVGIPQTEIKISARHLISNNRTLCGSSTGSRFQMQEMLEFAARHNIRPQVEVLPMSKINEAVTKLKKNEARYRLVLSLGRIANW